MTTIPPATSKANCLFVWLVNALRILTCLSTLALATGCAAIVNSKELNPDTARAGCGYVDFYITSGPDLYAWIVAWNIDDQKRSISNPDVFEKLHRSGGFPFGPVKNFVRVECAPGRHRFQIRAQMLLTGEKEYEEGIDGTGWFQTYMLLDVPEEMVTPVSLQFKKVPIMGVRYHDVTDDIRWEGIQLMRYSHTEKRTVPSVTLLMTWAVDKSLPYAKKEAMHYFRLAK